MLLNDFVRVGVLRNTLPSWFWAPISMFPNARWRQFCAASEIVQDYVSDRVEELRAKMDSGLMKDRKPMVQRLLESGLPSLDVTAEAIGHTVAGTDTTATTLSYMCYTLSQRPDVVQRLRSELESFADGSSVDMSVLTLPYLNAFLKEGLRLYGSAPSLLERVVPGVKTNSEPFSLLEYDLPAGTLVGAQSWSLSRDPSVFISPEEFMPERWLSEDTSAMAAHLFPYGFGTRACVGQTLAQLMLRLTVAGLVMRFDVEAPPETNSRSMDIRDMFIIFPASMSCKLRFIPRRI